MPPVVVAVEFIVLEALVFAGVTGVSAAAVTAISYGIIAVGLVGLSFGTSALKSALAKNQPGGGQVSGPSAQDVQQTLRQARTPRRVHYWLVKIGGAVGFYASKAGKFYVLIATAHRGLSSIEEHWLNDKAVPVDGDGYVTDEQYIYGGVKRVRLLAQLGSTDQLAQQVLIDEFPLEWTADHRARGVANTLMVVQDVPAEVYSSIYTQGAPALREVAIGVAVFDPRDPDQNWDDPATWHPSPNNALQVLDFLVDPDGMGHPRAMFNLASFAAAADRCADEIPLKDGGVEPRYRGAGSYDLDEDRVDVLKRMLASCDGEIYQLADGTHGLRVGVWEAPTVTITDDDILSYQIEEGANALAIFNLLKIVYVSPLHDFQEQDAEAWRDEASIALRGEEPNELRLRWCPSPSQARRLGKIATAKANPRWKGVVRTTFGAGLKALSERTITLHLSELDIAESFAVTQLNIRPDLSGCELQVYSIGASAYAWDADTEEGTAPAIPPETTPSPPPAEPTGFVAGAGSIVVSGGTRAAILVAHWDSPARDTISHEINYRAVGATDWLVKGVSPGAASWSSDVVENGVDFEIRLRARSPSGRPSDWTDVQEVTAAADATPPAQPTGFSSSKAGANVTLNWVNPNSANFYYVRVFRGTTNVFASAAEIATLFGSPGAARSYADNALANGTYWWWAQAFNGSDVGSTATGPQTQTIP